MILDIILVVVVLIAAFIAFLRGAIKEILGIIGIICSIILTISYSELLVDSFHFKSAIVNFIISLVLVYLVSFIVFSTLNGWLFHLLKSICQTPMDRFFGLFIGIFKGFFFSFLIFLGIELTCYTFSTDTPDSNPKLPKWVTEAKVYVVFSYVEDLVNDMIPAEFYENLKDLNEDIQDSFQKKMQEKDLEKHDDSKKTKSLFESTIED